MFDLIIESIDLNDNYQKENVIEFLEQFNLKLDNDVEYTLIIKNFKNKIIATASKSKNVFKCFAVKDEYRGENLTAKLVNILMDKCFEEKIYQYFIFTKPENIDIFENVNFKLICKTNEVALLESGINNIDTTLKKVKKDYNIDEFEKSAIVMNCNPFTLGHKYLIDKASQMSKEVIVFIVEEDKSVFPFKERYNLVKEGTKYLKNVKIIPSTEYIISSATFPSYFVKKEDTKLQMYTELDAVIFGEYFCKYFNITKRFVGDEPYCKITNAYNEKLKVILDMYNIKVVQVERNRVNNIPISASLVRKFIHDNEIEKVKSIVPQVTLNFLKTEKGREIMEKIKDISPNQL